MKKRTLSLLASSLLLASLSIHAAIPKGDGIIINDVSDMMNADGASSVSPVQSLKTFLAASTIKYVFPDFMNIQSLYLANNKALTTCSTKGSTSTKGYSLIYVSFNQLKVANNLGPECINGSQVTSALYQPGRMVLPMIDGDASFINGTNNTNQVVQLAKLIANTINADPHAAGVSFDLEGPALDDSPNAQTFIITLANALKSRYVAIFDGKTVMDKLDQLGKLPPNVILLHALYDEGVCNANHPNDPCSPKEYADHPILAPTFDYPVLYVLPAAATTRLYEKKIILNINAGETKKPLPAPDNLGSAQSCASILDPNKTPFNTSLAQHFLKLPKNMSGNAFNDFINPTDCKLYVNQGVTQDQYFTAALRKIDTADLNNNKNFIGITLYNAKPSYTTQPTRQFNAVTGAKGYYNIYTTTDPSDPTHYYYGYYPESITPAVWKTYQTWRQNHPIKQ